MAVAVDLIEQHEGEGDYLYFRRPDGSIDFADCGKGNNELLKHLNEGWEPLRDYGRFHVFEHTMKFPYETLLVRGGARELGAKQLVEMGWHLAPDTQNPPRYGPPRVPACGLAVGEGGHGGRAGRKHHAPACWRGAKYPAFPQLADATERGSVCTFCDDGLVYATAKARDQHVKVMHQDELRSARMGQELGAVLASKLGQMGMQIPAFACNRCTSTFETIQALAAHAETHTEQNELVALGAAIGEATAPKRGRPPTTGS